MRKFGNESFISEYLKTTAKQPTVLPHTKGHDWKHQLYSYLFVQAHSLSWPSSFSWEWQFPSFKDVNSFPFPLTLTALLTSKSRLLSYIFYLTISEMAMSVLCTFTRPSKFLNVSFLYFILPSYPCFPLPKLTDNLSFFFSVLHVKVLQNIYGN